jgi:hypothetical protein
LEARRFVAQVGNLLFRRLAVGVAQFEAGTERRFLQIKNLSFVNIFRNSVVALEALATAAIRSPRL